MLKDLIVRLKPSILGLLEPKVSGSPVDRICSILGFDQWVRIESSGFSGDIWLLWNNPIKLQIMRTHP